jgi:hypothetical protein
VVGGALLTTAMMLLVKHLRKKHGLPASPAAELAAGVALLFLALPNRFWAGGHLAEFGAPMFWIFATSLLIRGHSGKAAVLIGLSTAWEPWGLLPAGLLLIERNPQRLVRACALFAVAAVVPYLPFLATGHFAMFELRWAVVHDTLFGQLFPHQNQFGWAPRLLQGLGAGLAGCAAALTLGRRRDLIWLGPLAVVLVRLVLDPLDMEYYWQPVIILVVVGIGLLHEQCSPARLFLTLALLAPPTIQLHRDYPWPNSVYQLLIALALLIALIHRIRGSADGPDHLVPGHLEPGHHSVDPPLGGEHGGHRPVPGQLGQRGPGRPHQADA